MVNNEVSIVLKNIQPDSIYYYGTGCANVENAKTIKKSLRTIYATSKIEVNTDLLAAARAVCGR